MIDAVPSYLIASTLALQLGLPPAALEDFVDDFHELVHGEKVTAQSQMAVIAFIRAYVSEARKASTHGATFDASIDDTTAVDAAKAILPLLKMERTYRP